MWVGIASSVPARRRAGASPKASAHIAKRASRPATSPAVVVPAVVLLPARPRAQLDPPAQLGSAQTSDGLELSALPSPLPANAKRSTFVPSAPPCAGDLWLAGSVVNDARPRLSLAMVRRSAGTAVVSLGARVDDFTVLAIEATRARLRASDGTECALSEVPPGPRPVAVVAPPLPTAEPADKPPPGKAMFASGELAGGVRTRGPGSYTIKRDLVQKALANPGGAAGGAWFRLSERDGQRIGMEVRAVRDGTPLQAMGLRTGDVARSVNGIALDTPAGLIEALRAARESDTIAISILRDGQASDMRYTIE
jgi:hypothetical protein